LFRAAACTLLTSVQALSQDRVLACASTLDGLWPAQKWSGNRLTTHASILAADLTAFWVAFISAVWIRHAFGGQFIPSDYWRFLALLPGFIIVFGAMGLYPGVGIHPVRELRGIVYANSIGYLMMMAGTFLSKTGTLYSRLAFAGAWAFSIVLVALFRNLVRTVLGRQSWWGLPVVVLGAGTAGTRLVDMLRRQPSLGLKVAAILDDDPVTHTLARSGDAPPVIGGLSLAPLLADQWGIDYAIVAMPRVEPARLGEILSRYAHRFSHFLVIPNISSLGMLWVSTRDFGGILGLEISQNLLHTMPRVAKRVFDLSLVTIAGFVLLPLLALLAIVVRLTSRGPAIYSQLRIGRGRRPFRAYKFRTMQWNADELLPEYLECFPEKKLEWRANRKLRDDPRLTPIGRLLRRTSLDELPQLWNVLRGDMGLVGPRPIAEDELARYGQSMELYSSVLPGITGLWQVSGRNDTTYEERVRLDEYYVRNWSIWLDLWIVGRTARSVISGQGAY
jgi:Undecaprenyl-phosphate galactose phosphotransferase WbaP